MKKFLSIAIMLIVAAGITLGFIMEDPHGSKTTSTTTKNTGNNPVYVSYGTPVYTDNFDGANDTTALKSRGYKPFYRGTGPQGLTATWFQPSAAPPFPGFNGGTTGYVAANYNAVTGTNNIDSWLVLPRIAGGIIAGDSLYFYSRSVLSSTFPDSVRVMYSANDSVPEGTWVELGRFKTNTLTDNWVRKGFRAPTTNVNGRFAIRYCVANGGPSGANSDYMGVDALTIERTATPVVRTWTEQTSGVTTALYSISAVDDNVCWIAGAAGKVIKTTNKGTSWTTLTAPSAADVYCIYAFDANNAVVTSAPSTGTFIYRTSNGGTNWTQVFAETGGFGDGFYFLNATTGFFYGDPVGARWSLWKTTNAGTTWDSTGLYVPSAGAAGWNNAMFGLGNQIWFGSNAVNLPYSSNAGVSWANQTTPVLNQYSIWFNTATVGLSGGANLNVTTNSGTTWTALTSIGTGNVSGIVGEGTDWWFVRQAAGVNYSSNNGAAWVQQYPLPGTGGVYYHLTKSRTGTTIWGCRSLGGISRYGEAIVGVTPISTEVPANYSVSQNYPNPFNPTTKINFALPKSGLVTLKVYDITGKEVATLINEVKNVGTYAVDFNATNLSSGMYFYKISVNGFNEVKKMTLIK